MKAAKLWTPTFLIVIFINFFVSIIAQGSNAGSSVYLEIMGESTLFAGFGAAVFSGAAVLSRFICGGLIDKRSRSILMMSGGGIALLGTVGPLLVNTGALFIVWRFFQGLGYAITTTAAATAVSDILPKSRLGEGVGYYGLGQALSTAIGPAIALFLVAMEPAENLYVGLTLSGALAVVCAFFCRYEKHPEKLPETSAYRTLWEEKQAQCVAEKEAATDVSSAPAPVEKKGIKPSDFFEKHALPGAIPMFLNAPLYGFAGYFLGLYGVSLGVGNAGLFFTIAAVVMIVLRLTSKSFMDKIPGIYIFGASTVGALVCYVILLVCGTCDLGVSTDAVFYIAGAFYGISMGISVPICQTIALRYTPAARYGAANALFLLSIDLGMGAAAILWGVTTDAFGFIPTIYMVLALIVVAFVAALILFPKSEKSFAAFEKETSR